MSLTFERPSNDQTRIYHRKSSVVFLKTNAPFGGLSNMAGGFPLHVEGTRIYTSEALYQACRFPHLPEVQRLIIRQTSPMTAKMKSKPHREDSRPDWDRVRVKVMRWCLRMKLAQNWDRFSELLLRTGDRPIVEESRRDDFWGAKPVDKQVLVGMNVLGRLLMELREVVKAQGQAAFHVVEPPDIPKFLLLGRPIGTFNADDRGARGDWTSAVRVPRQGRIEGAIGQAELFDNSKLREGPAPAYPTSRTSWDRRFGELKLYPAMKDSGVPWLGKVPEHWQLRRTKTLLRERVEKGYPDEPLLAATQSRGVVRKEQYDNRTVLALKDLHLLKLARVGDFVISLRSFQGGIEYAREQGIISPAYTILYPVTASIHGYLARLFKSAPFIENLSLFVTGIRQGQNIDYEKLARTQLPLPPLPEQAAIVRFLDYMDRRIRRYIRAKQKLIKLLEEQKQAIIHRAVTRGLDPNVRLKPSGVEWLGDVPEHWEVRKIKHLARAGYKTFVDGDWIESPYITEEGVRLIQTGNIGRGVYREKGFRYVSQATFDLLRCTDVDPGDVLICRLGDPVGRACLAPRLGVRMITSVDVCILKVGADVSASFIVYAMTSAAYLDWVNSLVRGSTRDRVSRSMLGGFRVPVPPLLEQQAIKQFITGATQGVQSAVDAANREIDLLREYRTRLIADVVTGKLDVREAAARLPDEAEEPEPLDEIEAEGEADEAGAEDADEVPEEAEA